DTRFGDWFDTRRGLVQTGDQPSNLWGESVGELDMGNPQTLKDFADWGMTCYPADRYALVLWGHGDGQTVAFDDISHDGIRASELSTVLSQMPQKLDVLGADSCFMGNVEFAYQIKDNASVLVASQEEEPGTGWTYDTALRDLTVNPTMDAIDFGKTIVQRYSDYYATVPASSSLTLSAIDLSSLGTISQPDRLIGSLNLFANTLKHAPAADLTQIDQIRDRYDKQGTPDGYCDLLNLCASIAKTSSLTASIRNAATGVLNAFDTLNSWHYSSTFDIKTDIDTHQGLSIYFADRDTVPKLNGDANTLKFTQDTQWDDWLNSDLWR
ncbi:MAG TPA: clostripain-related cysteine peptidase, partial [Allocoleopsis sp.]